MQNNKMLTLDYKFDLKGVTFIYLLKWLNILSMF